MMQTAQNPQLAMISVPWQEYMTPMAPAEALMYGTVFADLKQTYLPNTMAPVCAQSAAPAHTMQPMQNMNGMTNMTTMQMQPMNMQKKR